MKKKTVLLLIVTLICATSFAQNKFTFLHYSDAHGSTEALDYIREHQINKVDFVINTGDILETNYYSPSDAEKFYTVLGNHDVAIKNGTTYVSDEEAATNTYMFKDEKGKYDEINNNGYFYKDFTKDGKNIRLIGLNSFEYKATGYNPTSNNDQKVVMSFNQIDWFAKLLMDTPSDYYILVALHAPAGTSKGFVKDNSYFQEKPNKDNATLQKYEFLKQYISDSLINIYYEDYINDFFTPNAGEMDPALIPEIVNAYLTRSEFTKDEVCLGYGKNAKLSFNFKDCKPAKFLCYLSGHVHVDLTNHLKEYPNQLLNDIACSNINNIRIIKDKEVSLFGFTDIVTYKVNSEVTCSDKTLSTDIAIDKITLDFDNRKLYIERIGRDSDKEGNLVRAAQTFKFEEKAEVKDDEAYNNQKENVNTIITYTRTFTTDAWQALYLPFSMKYEEWADKADIAEFKGINQKTDGTISLNFEIIPENGTTNPNTPYIIKPKTTGDFELTAENTTLTAKPEEDKFVSFTSDNGTICTLYGNYEEKTDMYEKDCYALANGKFMRANKGVKLGQNRIYLEVKAPEGNSTPTLTIAITDAESTGILTVSPDSKEIPERLRGCYNLAGQRLAAPTKGINIINGKKIVK